MFKYTNSIVLQLPTVSNTVTSVQPCSPGATDYAMYQVCSGLEHQSLCKRTL